MRMRDAGSTRIVIAAAVAVAAAGCALKSPPAPSELQADALNNAKVPAQWTAAGATAQPVAHRWLATFGDPALDAVVAEALLYNADLRLAAARVEQAGGYLKVASASLLPAVGVAARTGDKSGSGGSGLEGVFLSASLELDVWGRVRYGRAAADAQAVAAEADYAFARQSIAATVAKAWFLAVEAGQQRVIAQDAVRAAEMLQGAARERLRVGNGTELAVAEANANLGSYRDLLRQVEYAREQSLRALELLLGRYPSAEVAVATRLADIPAPVPAGLPSELLERRPDVVAAERRVAAAFYRVGEARAAQLPRISLTAGGSNVSSELFVLKEQDNPVWSIGASLLAPLYQGGALRAQVEIRSAEQKMAVADYARIAQRAFGEVEGALSAEAALRDRDAILAATLRDRERALELAQVQYRVGSVDLRSVEQGQLALYAARQSRLRVQAERLAQRVNLYLALGGSFEDPQLTAAATAAPRAAD